MADLYQVSPGGLESIWKQLSATWRERSRGRKEPTAEIRTLIMLREVQLWVALPDHEHLSRDHRNQPLGVVLSWPAANRLAVHMLAGRKLTAWLRPAARKLDTFARSRNLVGIDLYARVQWHPYLNLAFADALSPVAIERDDGLQIMAAPQEKSA